MRRFLPADGPVTVRRTGARFVAAILIRLASDESSSVDEGAKTNKWPPLGAPVSTPAVDLDPTSALRRLTAVHLFLLTKATNLRDQLMISSNSNGSREITASLLVTLCKSAEVDRRVILSVRLCR